MENCFATQALSQTQKNVSEPQTGIEPQPLSHIPSLTVMNIYIYRILRGRRRYEFYLRILAISFTRWQCKVISLASERYYQDEKIYKFCISKRSFV